MSAASFADLAAAARERLDACDFAAARARIEALAPDSLVERRIKLHLFAKERFRQGFFDEAIDRLRTARAECGPHVGLLADVAVAHFRRGDLRGWRDAIDELELEFSRCAPALSATSRWRTAILVAKSLEELGAADRSRTIVETLLEEAAPSLELEVAAECHALRLFALYARDRARSGEIYGRLLGLEKGSPSLYMGFEVQQALAQAEASLIGPRLARDRRRALSEDDRFAFDDLRALETDLAFEARLRGQPVDINQTKFTLDAYGKSLRELIADPTAPWDVGVDSSLTPLCRHHLWALRAQRGDSEARARLEFALAPLGAAAAQLWRTRLRLAPNMPARSLFYSHRERALICETRRADLSRSATLRAMLEALIVSPRLGIDACAAAVWGERSRADAYDRLRVASQRLNRAALELVCRPRIVEFTKTEISLLEPIYPFVEPDSE